MTGLLRLKRNRWTACLLLALGRATTVAAQEAAKSDAPLKEEEGYVLPLSYDPLTIPVPIVQVSINGKPPLPFAVDTGSSFLLTIDRWAADKLGVHATEETVVETPTKVFKAAVRSIVFIGADKNRPVNIKTETADIPVGITDFGMPKSTISSFRVAGIVGLPLLMRTTARFDFAAKTLTLFLKPHAPLKIQNATVLPLKTGQAGYTVSIPIGKGAPVDFLVDTGSFFTVIPFALASQLEPIATAEDAAWGVDGSQVYRSLLLLSLRIGDDTEPYVVVHTNASPNLTPGLGLDLLTRFRVTLDFRNRQMILERAKDYAERSRQPGSRDVFLSEQKGRFTVESVKPSSPADKAGVQKGDRLIQIDGYALAGMPPSVAQSLLHGFGGTKAELVIERKKGQRQTIAYTREALFAAPEPSRGGIGMEIALTDTGKWVITAVARSSQAEAAGLLPGDEIIEINGLSAVGMKPDVFAAQMKKPEGTEIILKVKRQGEEKPREAHLKATKRPEP